jgi:hypothetical protein
MEEDTLAHLVQQIKTTPLKTDPYFYFHTEQVFPAAFYQEILENIPDPSYFSKLDSYPQRSIFLFATETLERLPFAQFLFWDRFATSITSLKFANALLDKFASPLKERFGEKLPLEKIGIDLTIVRDQPGYFIGPHTDHPNKILTLLFYLPSSNAQKHLGTSIYIPKDRSKKCNGYQHHSFDDFDKVSTAPFIPNSVFGFLRSDCSFHGVEPINSEEKERVSLGYTLWEKE